MRNILKEISKDNIVTVYSDDVEDEFVLGFIYSLGETEIVLACVDHYGENNGFLLLELDGIYRIDFESVYEKKIECLYKNKGQQHDFIDFSKKENP